jgi:hypothetical protein
VARIASDYKDPRVHALQDAVIALGIRYEQSSECWISRDPESQGLRDGALICARVGLSLVIVANGECADDIEKLLDAALLATPDAVPQKRYDEVEMSL